MKAKIKDFSVSYDKTQNLTLALSEDFRHRYDELKDRELNVEIKIYRKKRSLNANALCWELCTKIANKLRTSKEEVYFEELKRYGQSEMISVKSGIDVKGYIKYFEEAGNGKINGREFTHYRVYKGSSEYDTEEMSIFLDGIISDCKDLNIPVFSRSEIELIKSRWGDFS